MEEPRRNAHGRIGGVATTLPFMAATSTRSPRPLPTSRGWWLVAAGVLAGLAIFLVFWSGQRGAPQPHPDDAGAPAAAAPVFRPLPVPRAPGPGPASGRAPAEASNAAPAAVDLGGPAGLPPVAGPDPRAAPLPPPEESVVPSFSPPVPIASPGPRYPARALRRGESGEVLLRVHVDARGLPVQIEVASSSGSRELDRAASNAVRRWRFRPATQSGEPVSGVVNVPVTFNSGR